MATFKYDGSMRTNDDTQLWGEILRKEKFASGLHKDY